MSKLIPSGTARKTLHHAAGSAVAVVRKRSLVGSSARARKSGVAVKPLRGAQALDLLKEAGIVSAEGTLNPAYR